MGARPVVRLVPIGEEHLAAIARLVADPDVLRYSRTPEPVPPGYERVWLDRVQAGRADGTMEVFAAVEPDFDDPDELREQIVSTLRHEIAHHFAADEDRVRELGL